MRNPAAIYVSFTISVHISVPHWERSSQVTSAWQKAWWWLLIAIVLTAPVLMLTGVLY
jgi:hypothetical protein